MHRAEVQDSKKAQGKDHLLHPRLPAQGWGERRYTSSIHPVLGSASQGCGKGDTPVMGAAPAPQKVKTEKKKGAKKPKQQMLRSWQEVSEVKAIQGEKSQRVPGGRTKLRPAVSCSRAASTHTCHTSVTATQTLPPRLPGPSPCLEISYCFLFYFLAGMIGASSSSSSSSDKSSSSSKEASSLCTRTYK